MKGMTFVLSILGMVMATSRVAAQWYQQSFPTGGGLFKVDFVDTTTGWVVGTDALYKTTDGGTMWIPQEALGISLALCAVNPMVAFYAPGLTIRKTTDGGTTWAAVDSGGFYYTDIEFVTPEVGYAGGAVSPSEPRYGILRKTTDGGASWLTVSTLNEPSEFEGISFLNEQEGWGITYYGTIYHTVDGGQSWGVQDSTLTIRNMRDIHFTSADSGWAVGGLSGEARVLQTTNGGIGWAAYDTQTLIGSSLREIGMLDSRTGFIVGFAYGPPTIVGTTDGGVTWEANSEYPSRQGGFESISMVDALHGWAVGDGAPGYVYKTTNGGATWVSPGAGVPSSFSLSQNYPNPFNPSTTITFSIPRSGEVRLKIFNLLGEEVATLVSGIRDAGAHTVQWDAAGQPSGVYFYRLQAGEFVETKKLVFLR